MTMSTVDNTSGAESIQKNSDYREPAALIHDTDGSILGASVWIDVADLENMGYSFEGATHVLPDSSTGILTFTEAVVE